MNRPGRLRSMSEKRKASTRTRYGSTFAIATPTAGDRIAAMPRRSTELVRSAPIKKSNPERVAKRDKEYQRKMAAYRRSETHRIVEARCQGRCEFFVGIVDGVRVASVAPRNGFVRCQHKRAGHHHQRYGWRFGGNELPQDMTAGCAPCHEYIEAMKPVHRHRRSA